MNKRETYIERLRRATEISFDFTSGAWRDEYKKVGLDILNDPETANLTDADGAPLRHAAQIMLRAALDTVHNFREPLVYEGHTIPTLPQITRS